MKWLMKINKNYIIIIFLQLILFPIGYYINLFIKYVFDLLITFWYNLLHNFDKCYIIDLKLYDLPFLQISISIAIAYNVVLSLIDRHIFIHEDSKNKITYIRKFVNHLYFYISLIIFSVIFQYYYLSLIILFVLCVNVFSRISELVVLISHDNIKIDKALEEIYTYRINSENNINNLHGEDYDVNNEHKSN